METLCEQLNINRHQVFRDIGYAADCKPSARMVSLVDEYVEHARDLIEPLYSYVIKGIVLVQGSHVILEDSVIFALF